MSEDNKELWRQFTKVWDAGDLDSLGDFVAADVVDHGALPGAPPGLEGVKLLGGMLHTAFPDRETTIHEIITEGDRTAALHTIRATNTGELMGMPPTGKPFEVNSIHIGRYAGGKLVEHWGLFDQGGMAMQIGVAPMPPGTEGWRPPPTSPQVKGEASGNPETNRKAMSSMIEGLRAGDPEKVLASVGDEVIDHAAMPGQGPGKEGVRWRFEQLFAGLSDADFHVIATVSDGGFLSQAYTFTATHSGPMLGMPPTNKSFTISAMDFVRFENGTMREHWGLIDIPSMMIQLGLMPPPG